MTRFNPSEARNHWIEKRMVAILGALVLITAATTAAGPEGQDAAGRTGYSLGHQIGRDLADHHREIDGEWLRDGLRDGFGGSQPSIPPDEMRALLLALKRSIESDSGESVDGTETRDVDDTATVQARRLGYSIGYQVGGDLRRQESQVDPEMVVRGALDAIRGSEPLLTNEEMRQALTDLQREAAKADARRKVEQRQANLAKGAAFLEANGARDGVVTLPSGLQYEVLAAGEGNPPGPSDTVTVHYRGTLIDGTQFDSSYDRGEPATFPLNRVIPGWTEGLQLMRPGARYRLYVPPELGYGQRSAGKIEPNSTLIFEVELISVG